MKTTLRVRASRSRDGWRQTQVLEKVWTIFGVLIWSKALDREKVPSHAIIEICTLGGTTWRSKWFGMHGVWWKTRDGYKQFQ